MTDFRTLCAELHAAFNTYAVDMKHHDLLERARAALAEQPVSEPYTLEPPDDREVAELVAWLHGQDGGIGRRATYSRIADLLSRLASQPVPEGPSDEELDDRPTSENIWLLAQEYFESPESGVTYDGLIDFARAVLARWGNLAAEG